MAISIRAGRSVWSRCLLCHLAKFIPLTCSLEESCRSQAEKRDQGWGSPNTEQSPWPAHKQAAPRWLCTLRLPKCQGCAGAGALLFLQRSLIPAYPCPCWCEVRGFPAFPSVTSIRPLCPWVVFAFLSQECAGEMLPFVSGCSLISRAVLLLFASMAKRKAAFAGEVHSWL